MVGEDNRLSLPWPAVRDVQHPQNLRPHLTPRWTRLHVNRGRWIRQYLPEAPGRSSHGLLGVLASDHGLEVPDCCGVATCQESAGTLAPVRQRLSSGTV